MRPEQSKPSIALIHFTCPPVVGGVEVVVEKHARLFADGGYPIRVIVGRGEWFDSRVPVTKIPAIDSLYPVNVEVNPDLKRGVMDFRYQSYRAELLSALEVALEGVDVVIVHNILVKDINFTLVDVLREMADRRDRCFVNWSHDPSAVGYNAEPWVRASREFPWVLINSSNPGVANVTISRARQRELSELYGVEPETITVIPDGVAVRDFLGLHPISFRIWQDFRLRDQDLVLFTPARIVEKKNIRLAIEVTAALNSLGRRAKLIVSGPPSSHATPGEHEAYYRRMKTLVTDLRAEDFIIFLYEFRDDRGERVEVTMDIIKDLYLLSDLLLVPSLEEGFGLPLLEAGLTKTPIACSDIEPFRELGGNDVLYIDLDETPLASAKSILDYLGRNSTQRLFKRVLTSYTWVSIFENRIEPFIQQTCLDRAGSPSANPRLR
ncbi:MAG: glycosyltransferase [Planctomycetes bacterium]|nr:glycosyltransferase [Planctomycetota bacterium]MBI3845743.1 glycosyltransferase [Planctomycetota bacterium]